MKIISEKVSVNAAISEVFSFLKDSNNIQLLLPQDKISEWKSDTTSCQFKIQGFLIQFVQDTLIEETQINMKSGDKAPFKFTLSINLEESNSTTTGYIEFDGDVNAFLKMMIEKPLTTLFNSMSLELQKHYANK